MQNSMRSSATNSITSDSTVCAWHGQIDALGLPVPLRRGGDHDRWISSKPSAPRALPGQVTISASFHNESPKRIVPCAPGTHSRQMPLSSTAMTSEAPLAGTDELGALFAPKRCLAAVRRVTNNADATQETMPDPPRP